MSELVAKIPGVRGVLAFIGHTPLVPLQFESECTTIHAKREFLKPSGSVKDRLAKSVLLEAEQGGWLRPDLSILERSSGNTGIGVAMVGGAMGYRVTILMSSSANEERRRLITQPGADFDSSGMYQNRLELLWCVQEQSISIDYRRYGNLGSRANEPRSEPL